MTVLCRDSKDVLSPLMCLKLMAKAFITKCLSMQSLQLSIEQLELL